MLVSGTSLSVQRRLGKTEHVERSEGQDLGLRVFLGQHVAIVSSSSVAPSSLRALAERAVAMARVVPEDPYAGLADTAVLPEPVALDLEDASEPATEALVARAAAAEEERLSRWPGSPIRRGLDAGFGRTEVFLVTSAGFAGSLVCTSHSISASAIAGAGTGMQRDYDYHSTVHLADLDEPTAIGAQAQGSARLPGSIRHGPAPRSCRWFTTHASQVGWWGIWPALSMAPRLPAARHF